MFATALQIMLAMPSEMKTGAGESYRTVKKLRKCKHVATKNVDNNSSTAQKYHNSF